MDLLLGLLVLATASTVLAFTLARRGQPGSDTPTPAPKEEWGEPLPGDPRWRAYRDPASPRYRRPVRR